MMAVQRAPSVFDLAGWSRQYLDQVEQALGQWVGEGAPAGLGEAMRYAVLDGGKRLRPLLVMAAFEAVHCGAGDDGSEAGLRAGMNEAGLRAGMNEAGLRAGMNEAALRAACAVELIHAYSLVHDDMPCMDNDVLRRGKPTVHVQFGEALALLAGDALQAFAFELLTPDKDRIPAAVQATLCRQLARAAGSAGMAGGQAIDLASVGLALTQEQLRQMHRLKTGALLQASVMMGAACGAASVTAHKALADYGAVLGLAFQVVDDILDVVADSATLGKTAGKDAVSDKPTYVSLLGLAPAQAHAQAELAQAHAALATSGLADTRALAALADMVVNRSY
jgi:farnesyl diphosphate synthase